MDEDEKTHNVNIDIDGIDMPGGLGWIFALGIIFCLSFEGEIRCSLGNQIECAKMAVKK